MTDQQLIELITDVVLARRTDVPIDDTIEMCCDHLEYKIRGKAYEAMQKVFSLIDNF